jgi:hypothetical protein
LIGKKDLPWNYELRCGQRKTSKQLPEHRIFLDTGTGVISSHCWLMGLLEEGKERKWNCLSTAIYNNSQ